MEHNDFHLIHLEDFVVLDIETTGLSPEVNDIIEFAAIKYQHGVEIDRFQTFINPSHKIPEAITRLTSITNDDVRNAPIIEEKIQDIFKFIGELPVVGHNVDFDLSFIEYAARKIQDDFDGWDHSSHTKFHYVGNMRLDTLTLSTLLFPFLNSHKLTELSRYFKLEHATAHRAMDDVQVTAELFLICLNELVNGLTRPLRYVVKLLEPIEHPMKLFFVNILNAKINGHFEETQSLIALNQISQSNFNIIGKAVDREKQETHTFQLIDEQLFDDFFSESGALSQKFSTYEVREEQVALAKAIGKAFNEGEFLVSEAGTGTGKSLAYLVPSLFWAERNRKNNARVVVSTNTKNLQEQLFFKDLPLIQSVFNRPFQAVMLKGKTNYLCKDKWFHHIDGNDGMLSNFDRHRVLPLIYWKEYTQTGDVAENTAFHVERHGHVWNKFVAENNYCSGKLCKFYSDCHLIDVRNAAREADLVVVNHSLLFSSLQSENSILGDFKNLVFDEAHNIEKVATDYLGSELNIWMFKKVINTLYQGEQASKSLLVRLYQRVEQSKLKMKSHVYTNLCTFIDRLKNDLLTLNESYLSFFDEVSKLLRLQANNRNDRIRYEDGTVFFSIIQSQIKHLSNSMETVLDIFSNLNESLKELEEDTIVSQLQIKQEFQSLFTDLQSVDSIFNTMMNAGLEDYVFWAEPPHKIEANDAKFFMAPIHINNLLERLLYSKLETSIFTSATMQVNHSFEYFIKRTGLNFIEPGRLSECTVGSPFDYKNQIEIRVANFLYDPSHQMYTQSVIDLVLKIAEERLGGILILFTSYYMLNEVYNAIKFTIESKGSRRVLAQGKDGSRSSLTKQMKENIGTILLGTDSFWEGVDISGEALENVIITKLPFAVPSDPIVAAKMDEIKHRGGNSFMDYSVPEAIIKFRQGFGRLIRSVSDSGVVFITDNRVSTKRYGKMFLDALPAPSKIYLKETDYYSF